MEKHFIVNHVLLVQYYGFLFSFYFSFCVFCHALLQFFGLCIEFIGFFPLRFCVQTNSIDLILFCLNLCGAFKFFSWEISGLFVMSLNVCQAWETRIYLLKLHSSTYAKVVEVSNWKKFSKCCTLCRNGFIAFRILAKYGSSISFKFNLLFRQNCIIQMP